MKRTFLTLIMLLLIYSTEKLEAQTKIDQSFKEKSVLMIDRLINDFYVFPDLAKETGEHLKQQFEKGQFDSINDIGSFSKALTQELQSINKDKHMRVVPTPAMPRIKRVMSQEEQIDFLLKNINSPKEETGGFMEVKKLKNNIGYLDLRSFPHVNEGAVVADAYMKLLQSSDAIIIDLRYNGGGSPSMVQYLCSFFFDKKIHLNSIYYREGDTTKEFWTLEKVNGMKLPDVPLFVLTSNRTFSGAEEFSYNMQTQKRATLIGETTGGGANPGGLNRINDHIAIFIPNGTAINPITKTNWEGVGVVPEIKTNAEDAFDKAFDLATKEAVEYRQNKYDAGKKILTELFVNIDKTSETSFTERQLDEVVKQFKLCIDKGLLNEGDINIMGYTHLESNLINRAELIFKANILLFPNSPNTYDSYADALIENNKKDLALKAYEKAIEIAIKNNDPNIEIYKENLARVKKS